MDEPKAGKIRIRKTPYGLHQYTATIKGMGTYGWGNTPSEAKECLLNFIERDKKNEIPY